MSWSVRAETARERRTIESGRDSAVRYYSRGRGRRHQRAGLPLRSTETRASTPPVMLGVTPRDGRSSGPRWSARVGMRIVSASGSGGASTRAAWTLPAVRRDVCSRFGRTGCERRTVRRLRHAGYPTTGPHECSRLVRCARVVCSRRRLTHERSAQQPKRPTIETGGAVHAGCRHA
jgi:hypothetical protein